MPLGVTTVTSSTPGVVVAGEVAVIDVSLVVAVMIPGVVPKSTAVAPVNPVPVMVTLSAPEIAPEAGDIEVTVGALAADANAAPESAMAAAIDATVIPEMIRICFDCILLFHKNTPRRKPGDAVSSRIGLASLWYC